MDQETICGDLVQESSMQSNLVEDDIGEIPSPPAPETGGEGTSTGEGEEPDPYEQELTESQLNDAVEQLDELTKEPQPTEVGSEIAARVFRTRRND